MNPVLLITHNNLELTKRCVESLRNQDIPVDIFSIDNGSSDETVQWSGREGILLEAFITNSGFSHGINTGLKLIFGEMNAEYCLVTNTDTIIPSWFYREALSYNLPFVSGISVDNMDQIATCPDRHEISPHPDFSAWVIRNPVLEKVGPFDETMVSWCSDNDFHYRAHRMGISLVQANLPFYHVRSRTIELAPPKEHRQLQMQADADRLQFREKWHCDVWTKEYAELFCDASFGIDLD